MPPLKTIESRSTTLDALLNEVEQGDVALQVLRDGRPVAEVRPIANLGGWRLPPIDERLKPDITPKEALSPLDELDWSSEARS